MAVSLSPENTHEFYTSRLSFDFLGIIDIRFQSPACDQRGMELHIDTPLAPHAPWSPYGE